MNSGLRRITARLAATTLVGGVLLSGTTAAQAWTLGTPIGTATVGPAHGTDSDTPVISTSGACDDPAATNSQLVLYGSGFPSDGYNVSANNNNTILPKNPAGGYDVPLAKSLAAFALLQPTPATYVGTYTIVLVCKHSFGVADYGDYPATLTFTDPNHYTSGGAVATTTTLAASPAGSATVHAAVTFTASVTPVGAAGSVQFLDGATALGTATVIGTSATLTTTALAVGGHSLTAVFTPTSPTGATASTSTAVAYSIAPAQALVLPPAVAHASAFVLPVGTKLTCPGGSVLAVPGSQVGKAIACNGGGANIVVVAGARPIALVAPSLSGTGKVGSKLVLKPGLWTPAYSSRTVVWKRDGKVIAKQPGGFYVVKKTDKGHKISATVTAHLAGHPDGTASTSAVKGRVAPSDSPLAVVARASLDGVAGDSTPLGVPVGSVIGCVPGDFTGATTTTSGWLVDGKVYPAQAALLIPDALAGHQLVCRTSGTGPGGTTVSDAVANVTVGAKLFSYVAPHITGTAKVGKKLTAVAGKWFPVYSKATFLWLRNGAAIKGATKSTYVTTAADKKHKIAVRVTVTRSGWVSGAATSAVVSVG